MSPFFIYRSVTLFDFGRCWWLWNCLFLSILFERGLQLKRLGSNMTTPLDLRAIRCSICWRKAIRSWRCRFEFILCCAVREMTTVSIASQPLRVLVFLCDCCPVSLMGWGWDVIYQTSTIGTHTGRIFCPATQARNHEANRPFLHRPSFLLVFLFLSVHLSLSTVYCRCVLALLLARCIVACRMRCDDFCCLLLI